MSAEPPSYGNKDNEKGKTAYGGTITEDEIVSKSAYQAQEDDVLKRQLKNRCAMFFQNNPKLTIATQTHCYDIVTRCLEYLCSR